MVVHTQQELKGIHYAPPRNNIRQDTWDSTSVGFKNTWLCEEGCTLLFGDQVNSIFLRLSWQALNPEQDVYDWTSLDGMLDEIILDGKTATLGIMAGRYTPDFVFTNGCMTVGGLTYNPGNEAQLLVPIPHDATYRDAYNTFMKAMALHLAGVAGYNDAVLMVKTALVSAHSVECRISPIDAYDYSGLGLSGNAEKQDHVHTMFCNAGYQEALVLQTIAESANVIRAAFPDMFVGIPFVRGSNRFPTNGVGVFPDLDGTNTTINRACVGLATVHTPMAMLNDTTFEEGGGDANIFEQIFDADGSFGAQLNAQSLGYRSASSPNDPDAVAATINYANDFTPDPPGTRRYEYLFVEVHDGNMSAMEAVLIAGNALLNE